MTSMVGRGALLVVRLAGLAALVLIAVILAGWSVPLHAHMAAGGLAVLGLWVLAWVGRHSAPRLAFLGPALGVLVPVVGMAQLHWPWGDGLAAIQVMHGVAGLAAISVGEMIGRRLRLAAGPDTLYGFSVTDGAGGDHPLAQYRGKVVLIVNTASQCGFTPQYQGLQALYQDYGDRGLVVLGFPCNQFGRQEPGSAADIATFCQRNYGVDFPVLAKIAVNGAAAPPLFVWLKDRAKGLLGSRAIKWNFTKFLIDRQGRPVARFAPFTRPAALRRRIEALL